MTSEHRIRKEIQFLRAVAVTLVVLSHLGFGKFSGGFVGVDMFFVVSGFVIGLTMVNEQISSGKVSFKRFFERRFFRIFPPLSFMVVVMTVYAYFIVPFTKAQDFFIQQARAALFSYGNFFFMFRKLNYFVQSGDITFFLHTWSLGVEEQFYIALPFVLGVLALIGRQFDASGAYVSGPSDSLSLVWLRLSRCTGQVMKSLDGSLRSFVKNSCSTRRSPEPGSSS